MMPQIYARKPEGGGDELAAFRRPFGVDGVSAQVSQATPAPAHWLVGRAVGRAPAAPEYDAGRPESITIRRSRRLV